MDLPIKIEILFERYLENKCSLDEIKLLSEYFAKAENESAIRSLIKTEIEFSQTINSVTANPQTKKKLRKIFDNLLLTIHKLR